MQINNVAIIGIGLIGGSVAKALKNKVHVASLKRDCLDLQMAVEQNALDLLFDSWEDLITWSDAIILAAPLSTLTPLAEEIARLCPKEKKLIVMDVGSVKKAVFPAFEVLTTDNLDFISTHPMAGKEKWGFAHSDESLFQGCCWILSPHDKNQSSNLDAVTDLIRLMGGETRVLDVVEHDAQAALVSHLPALLSRLYLQFAEENHPESLRIAGPGFKSMTRLAGDNPQMQKEIAELNREEILKQLASFLTFMEKERVS